MSKKKTHEEFVLEVNKINPNIAVEYNGEQHYQPIDFFGGQEYLEYIQLHDHIKSDYCKTHNIYLLCIPYWENVEEILEKFLLI